MLVLLARAARTQIVAADLAEARRDIGGRRGGGLSGARCGGGAGVDLVPAGAYRVGERPDHERTKGLGKLVVVLDRHVQRDSGDMVRVVEEPWARVDHVYDRP